QGFVRGSSPKLHLNRPRRSAGSLPHSLNLVLVTGARRRFETRRGRECSSHIEISGKCIHVSTGRGQVLSPTTHVSIVHRGDQGSRRLPESQTHECNLGRSERGMDSS